MANANGQNEEPRVPLIEALREIARDNPRIVQNVGNAATGTVGDIYATMVWRLLGFNLAGIMLSMIGKSFGTSSIALICAAIAGIVGFVFFFKPKFLFAVPTVGAILGIPLEGKFEDWAGKAFRAYRVISGSTIATLMMIYTVIALFPLQWSLPGAMILGVMGIGYGAVAWASKDTEIDGYLNGLKKLFLFGMAVAVFLVFTMNGSVFRSFGINTSVLAQDERDAQIAKIEDKQVELERKHDLNKLSKLENIASERALSETERTEFDRLKQKRMVVERAKGVWSVPQGMSGAWIAVAGVVAAVTLAIAHFVFVLPFRKKQAAGVVKAGDAKKSEAANAVGALIGAMIAVAAVGLTAFGSYWLVSTGVFPWYVVGGTLLALFVSAHIAGKKVEGSALTGAIKWGSFAGIATVLLMTFVLGSATLPTSLLGDGPTNEGGPRISPADGFKYVVYRESTGKTDLVPSITLGDGATPLCKSSSDCGNKVNFPTKSSPVATSLKLVAYKLNSVGVPEPFELYLSGGTCANMHSGDNSIYMVCQGHDAVWMTRGGGKEVTGKFRISFIPYLGGHDARVELYKGDAELSDEFLWATLRIRLRQEWQKR